MSTRLETLQAIRNRVIQQVIPVSSSLNEKQRKERDGKIIKANRYCDLFFAEMLTGNGLRSEAEAIQKIAPVAIWFIGWLARQFAVQVIKALWREWHNTTGVQVSTSDFSHGG
jgi:hypothetical protein